MEHHLDVVVLGQVEPDSILAVRIPGATLGEVAPPVLQDLVAKAVAKAAGHDRFAVIMLADNQAIDLLDPATIGRIGWAPAELAEAGDHLADVFDRTDPTPSPLYVAVASFLAKWVPHRMKAGGR